MLQGGIRWHFATSPTPPPVLFMPFKILKKFKNKSFQLVILPPLVFYLIVINLEHSDIISTIITVLTVITEGVPLYLRWRR